MKENLTSAEMSKLIWITFICSFLGLLCAGTLADGNVGVLDQIFLETTVGICMVVAIVHFAALLWKCSWFFLSCILYPIYK